MATHPSTRRGSAGGRRWACAAAGLLLVLISLLAPAPAAGAQRFALRADVDAPAAAPWLWPVAGPQVVRAFQAPAHEYGAGHRGLDLRPHGDTSVRAPRAGIVAFSGRIADRGILTIDHGDGYVTTLEPVTSDVAAGTPVEQGEIVGAIAAGGHAEAGTVHFGVRLDGEYLNPLLLLGALPRAVLLPCCS
ncbi:M23 family metallopeptidase [Microbacterium horticulturae]|uniref:M23 family metallopeptidase n=1 Tax=Microbacterium horticulturae TaxID=3028316 RepID=A0ABY8C2C6_9MICO|nr:M23 family metallopeptidase [Microbacterium sp. KACC 23027]WEG10600.1 M23 family metallopeptidase [Microbacterium sp. KACC 23027]